MQHKTLDPGPQQVATPTAFVLFGATGDLARRMVLPAFYDLFCRGLTPKEWVLIGNGRGDVAHEDFRDHVHKSLVEFGPGEDKIDQGQWAEFSKRLRFAGGGFDEDDPGSLLDVINEAAGGLGEERQFVHYLAIPPSAFGSIASGLAAHDLLQGSKVVFEKPYGESLESFGELDQLVHSLMDEDQVFRIDHFLGKEATQNLHMLRFGNAMINNNWSADAVAQVQIDAPETLDVAQRAAFYDATGAFKDMIVTHLFQVAAEVAMEPPASMAAEDLQTARESVLGQFRPLDSSEVVLGQFDGYTEIDKIADDSTTDTLAAVRLWVDTDRWRGVPFLLRSGKRMAGDHELVSLIMKEPKGPLGDLPDTAARLEISLKGKGGIGVALILKHPGPGLTVSEQRIDLSLADVDPGEGLDPYVALLHDVLIGDRSLFTSSDGLAHAWRVADSLLKNPPRPISYQPGSWGPEEATELTGGLGWVTQRNEQAG
ncbi:glucose-6-phosphate dehydrogenase [Microlunatus elymi]|uniref:Glucose-6-phosphate 1-dehydrogenase n=1 Tax=Microlunatus elymi TaxID=2596828 RepID=A0A516Q308_9ACTN|nr:glucose-6-phosphate dehydrogenase [Microlunatus elymi]QDP97815.1 glucose-6-phosphate dehydrogenase [Microlunatus elymi]